MGLGLVKREQEIGRQAFVVQDCHGHTWARTPVTIPSPPRSSWPDGCRGMCHHGSGVPSPPGPLSDRHAGRATRSVMSPCFPALLAALSPRNSLPFPGLPRGWGGPSPALPTAAGELPFEAASRTRPRRRGLEMLRSARFNHQLPAARLPAGRRFLPWPGPQALSRSWPLLQDGGRQLLQRPPRSRAAAQRGRRRHRRCVLRREHGRGRMGERTVVAPARVGARGAGTGRRVPGHHSISLETGCPLGPPPSPGSFVGGLGQAPLPPAAASQSLDGGAGRSLRAAEREPCGLLGSHKLGAWAQRPIFLASAPVSHVLRGRTSPCRTRHRASWLHPHPLGQPSRVHRPCFPPLIREE